MMRGWWALGALLVVGLYGCEDRCMSYSSAGPHWSASECPDGSDYELDCEPVDGQSTSYSCRCIKDGTVTSTIQRSELVFGYQEEDVRVVNEACGWDIPSS
ncbi:MAG: hypothetical protein R3B82_30390 [Sandaracinaceae bacterium]